MKMQKKFEEYFLIIISVSWIFSEIVLMINVLEDPRNNKSLET